MIDQPAISRARHASDYADRASRRSSGTLNRLGGVVSPRDNHLSSTCHALFTRASFSRGSARRKGETTLRVRETLRAFARADTRGEDARTIAEATEESSKCTYAIVGRVGGPVVPAENPLPAVCYVLPRETNMAVRQPLELQRLHLAVAVLYHKINTPRCYQHRRARLFPSSRVSCATCTHIRALVPAKPTASAEGRLMRRRLREPRSPIRPICRNCLLARKPWEYGLITVWFPSISLRATTSGRTRVSMEHVWRVSFGARR